MADFAIASQKGGIAENVPSILLSEAFMARDSENIHERYGRYDRLLGRLPDLYDSENVKIKTPTDIYTITAINSGTKTLTVTGDVTSGNTVLADGATIRINGGTTAANNITFTVDGTPTYSSPSSTVVVAEAISAAGATPGNLFVGATPVIEYHRHIRKGTGTEHLLLGTKYHILLWLQSDRSLTVKWTCVDPDNVHRWEICDHLRNVVATNNSDYVLWWNVDDSTANAFAALNTTTGIKINDTGHKLTKCKYITSYENYLILGYTTENATVYPQRERWADLGTTGDNTDDFNEDASGDAGAKDFTSTPGFLMGFARHGGDLVISKQDSMHRSWVVSGDTVFEWEEYTLKVGNLSADSLVNDKAGRLYWMGSDLAIHEINTPQAISTAVDITVKGLNTAQAEYIQATYIDEYEEVWWAFASSGSSTNDTIVAFHPDRGRAFIYKIPVRAFGDYTQQTAYTYDTLPYDTYDDWGAAWLIYDTSRNVIGFPLDLASDYLGNTFDLHRADNDDGNAFTGKLILSTTLTVPKSFNVFKRVNNGVDVIMNRKSSGSVTLYAKRDTEASKQLLGTASMVDADSPETVISHVPFDIRARSFQFQIETTGRMELIGLVFRDFELDDAR